MGRWKVHHAENFTQVVSSYQPTLTFTTARCASSLGRKLTSKKLLYNIFFVHSVSFFAAMFFFFLAVMNTSMLSAKRSDSLFDRCSTMQIFDGRTHGGLQCLPSACLVDALLTEIQHPDKSLNVSMRVEFAVAESITHQAALLAACNAGRPPRAPNKFRKFLSR